MKNVSVLGLLLFVVSTTSLFAKPIEIVEKVIESESLQIKITKDLTGIVRGKVCDACGIIVVKITPLTKLYIKGKEADLSKAGSRSGKPGTAVFNVKTRQVTRIRSY